MHHVFLAKTLAKYTPVKALKTIFCATSAILTVLTITSCSDAQNRKDSNNENSFKGSSVSIKVISRSTTLGTETTPKLDKDIEGRVTKTLSQVLISGEGKQDLFSQESRPLMPGSFPNYKKAEQNTADVEFSFLNSTIDVEKVVVASLTQKIKMSDKEKITNIGKVYFNSSGIIVGFDLTTNAPVKGY